MKDVCQFHRVKLGLFAIEIVVGNVVVRIIEFVRFVWNQVIDSRSTVAQNTTLLNKFTNSMKDFLNSRIVGRVVGYTIFGLFN